MSISRHFWDRMQETSYRAMVESLRAKIKSGLPHYLLDRIELSQGRWYGLGHNGSRYAISHALDHERQLAPLGQQREAWRKGLSDETANGVMAMCQRLLRGNPNSRFVREVYPQLFEQLRHPTSTIQAPAEGAYPLAQGVKHAAEEA